MKQHRDGERSDSARDRSQDVLREVQRTLSPEFINRIDETIVFAPLTDEQLNAIARLMVAQVNDAIHDKGISLHPSDEAYSWLIGTSCKDRSFGARPLRRAIQKHIEDALSEKVIRGDILGAGEVEVLLENGKLVFKEVGILNSLKD